MKIDVYEPIKVKWDYSRPNLDEDCADIVVYFGSAEVHRKRDVARPTMWSGEDYEQNQFDMAVGEFGRKITSAIGMTSVIG